ncbi:M23 family metallopeptidase [Streptomyces lunaelactis]|uniref:M23 family metallopeptidase n=1 Tax=Streptomyces lunaelactis TaxID=1535768 RepID=UPI0015859560|nr:M23 family metallopeptidase [Streptomyces lunaelactis]NUK03810.1 M23 family metallopeptidase [Streptomyces lunaelactis]NUK17611.1 M23 family metallopeptidase [Streptomyces lunaelactis]NUK25729.1 M23 family metallopeptidase [Streptomyces lunaelactis]NUK37128.1 M23 family metallopeptidase [Streptomyces lunaelactis]NUK43853.1 M23 family metallopeptidase [Streptomyces lunaelactis]
MSKRATSRHPRPSVLRTRAAVLAAGLGTSMVLGAGAAFAAGTGTAAAAAPAVVNASSAVAAQAQAQAKAAGAAKQAVAAKAVAAKAVAKKAPAKKAVAWVKPVTHYTLTASFNQGGAMWSHKHSGQDFAVPVGTTVKAAGSGTVVKAGPNGGGDGPAYGNAIVIKHANGKYSQYAHLSKINVHIGQSVKVNQKIALSGNTGNSSGPHLHFEIRTTPNYGSALNPSAFLRTVGVTI